MSNLWPFTLVSILLAVTPGPDMAVVTRNALARGRRGVVLTTGGIGLALLCHVSASALGLSALLRASPAAFDALRLLGGGYLGLLGARTLFAGLRPAKGPTESVAGTAGSDLRQGFLTCLLNPKLLAFFLSFLPQFVEPSRRGVLPLMTLGLLFAGIGYVWLNLYGLLVTRLRTAIEAPRVRMWMERVTGVVLVGFGARLVFERL
ncbi:MAG: LysE family translocator [Candidatus Dormibacteria bacterium]